jgi:phosphonate metabolism transcriptional regulator PhnF
VIKKNTEISCYRQLSAILMEQIENGVFASSSQLPTEMEMSRKYKLNRHTVRRALEVMEDEGLVYRIKGKGTFVADRKIPYRISTKTQFTTSILAVGLHPEARLLNAYEIAAGEELAEHLTLPPEAKITVLEILRLADQLPVCFTTSYLSAARFPGLQSFLTGSFSLYQTLREGFGVEARRASSTFEVAMPEGFDQEALQLSPKIPILIVKSTAKDQYETIVEYCITKFRGDSCSIKVDLTNGER